MKKIGQSVSVFRTMNILLSATVMLVVVNNACAHDPGSSDGLPEKEMIDCSKHRMEAEELAATDHSIHKMEEQEPAAKMARDEALAKSRDVVAVMNAWVREAVTGTKVNGGYMTLVNGSDEEVVLERIESSSFDSVEIHKMGAVDGMMKMQRVESLPIKVGGNEVLKPGGRHLMMIGPDKDLVSGDSVELVLHFASGSVQVITLPVKK